MMLGSSYKYRDIKHKTLPGLPLPLILFQETNNRLYYSIQIILLEVFEGGQHILKNLYMYKQLYKQEQQQVIIAPIQKNFSQKNYIWKLPKRLKSQKLNLRFPHPALKLLYYKYILATQLKTNVATKMYHLKMLSKKLQ